MFLESSHVLVGWLLLIKPTNLFNENWDCLSGKRNSFWSEVIAENIKDEGITTVAGIYSVDNIVARAQMADFLTRAFIGMP